MRVVIAKCRERNKAGVGTLGDAAHPACNLVSIHPGHHEVAEHEVRALSTNLLKPLLAICRHVYPRTEMSQQCSRQVAMIGMVLNNQNGHAFQGHGVRLPRTATRGPMKTAQTLSDRLGPG